MRKTILLLCIIGIALLASFICFAPGFLFAEELPFKADAVVLFVGPENEARLEAAKQFIREGYARYLIIPSYAAVYDLNRQGDFERIEGFQPADEAQRKIFFRVRVAACYRKGLENTHIEALEAKRTMDDLGLRSALLVSSGYHLRRIRLISRQVFAPSKYRVRVLPVRWQEAFSAGDWLDSGRRKIILSEYMKLGWLLLYRNFV